jgi:hypothetical protein
LAFGFQGIDLLLQVFLEVFFAFAKPALGFPVLSAALNMIA